MTDKEIIKGLFALQDMCRERKMCKGCPVYMFCWSIIAGPNKPPRTWNVEKYFPE